MSERMDHKPIDDAALEDYLKGGSDVSQRYREASNEGVPPELDARVLESARAAAGAKQRTRSTFPGQSPWMRWGASVALAASAVLVVSIVIESGVHQGEAPLVEQPAAVRQPTAKATREERFEDLARQDAQRTAPAGVKVESRPAEPPAPAPAAPPPTQPVQVTVSAKRAQQLVEQSSLRANAPAADFAPSPSAAVAHQPTDESKIESTVVTAERRRVQSDASVASAVDEIAVTGARARRAAPRASGPRDTIRQIAAPQAQQEAAETGASRTPEEWLQDIRELRIEGRHDEADEEWNSFLEAYPDHPVADSDSARKRP